jgi:hypothetical protein
MYLLEHTVHERKANNDIHVLEVRAAACTFGKVFPPNSVVGKYHLRNQALHTVSAEILQHHMVLVVPEGMLL